MLNLNAKTWKRAAMGALSCFLLTLPAAAVDPTPQQAAEYAVADETSRIRLLMKLAMSGQQDLARTLLQRHPLRGDLAKNRTLFIEGLLLKADGDLTGAVQKFRDALADDPGLTLVRAELAKTLVALEQDDSAKHHLDILAQSAPSESAASDVRSFIDQLDQRRPLKFSAFVSLAPSTNINSGSNHTTATVYDPFTGLPRTATITSKESGVGASIGGSAGYSKRLGNDFSFVAAANAYGALYEDPDTNTYGFSQSLEIRRMLARGYIGMGLVASQSISHYSTTVGLSTVEDFDQVISYGPRVSLQYNVTANDRVNLSGSYEWKDSIDRDVLDGTTLGANGSVTHTFGPGVSATVFAGYSDVETGLGYNSFESVSGGVGFYKELPFGTTVDTRLQYQQSAFDDPHPLTGTARQDQRYATNIGLTKRDFNIFGFAPELSYTYVRNVSNVTLYDYDSHSLDFRLTKDF